MLSDKKQKLVDLLIEGKSTKTDIAKLLDVSRTCIYDYLDDPEVQAELNTRLTAIRDQSQKKFVAQLDPVIDELYKIALTATDTRSRKDACIYLINRVLGTPTNNSNITDERNQDEDIDILAAFESVTGENKEDTEE
ncbi:helix-turn-helix domain-containing protein [Caproiciproducens sp. CPB-2]|uniref:helix-turn-helix domain-containing protein n=1 Tax=Caproiciproducens sp. CPB-2 TaxID=3030017 RepID=UPI0023DBF688|nr:helix-turn-helix domain-containing protein [Caproiciproducens sp. CPB-2]MDF1496328.1 helix-turn-helix domain-containing protein [Caproiciproducens sp. CPB-2]